MVRATTALLIVLLLTGFAARAEDEEEPKQPGWLGVSIQLVERDGASQLVVERVVADSPAAKAGLQAGDVILRVGDRSIDGTDALRAVLSNLHAGDRLQFRVLRGEAELDIVVTLGVPPPPPPRGIRGKKAPKWQVEKWAGLAKGVEKLDVGDFKGKVVYLYCFQSWCPGCHEHGFPTLQAVRAHYEDTTDVAFVIMQTVFEGFETNTFERGQAVLKKYGLALPYAMSGTPEKRSAIMRDYNAGGTPWTIVIDPEGVVRFDGFTTKTEDAIKLIDGLRPKPPADEPDADEE